MEDFNTRLNRFVCSSEVAQETHDFYVAGRIGKKEFKQLMFKHSGLARKYGLVWSEQLWKDVYASEYMDMITGHYDQLED